MVHIQNKAFKLYQLDTEDSILQRIASTMKTTKKYLYFPEGIPDFHLVGDNNIVVRDILYIIKSRSKELDFDALVDEITPMITQQGLSIEDDILPLFIAFNTDIPASMGDDIKATLLLVLQVQIEAGGYIPTCISLEYLIDLEKNRNMIKTTLDNDVKFTATQAKMHLDMVTTLESASGVPFTEFELERTNFDMKVASKNISIIELFNSIQLNLRAPFASSGVFYKILNDFVPKSEWSFTLEDSIVIKINQYRELIKAVDEDDYTNAIISIEGVLGKEVVNVNMVLDSTKNKITKDEYIESFMKLFQSVPDFNIIDTVEDMINGTFYMYQRSLDIYVLSDLIMNNPLFASLMSIDESNKATKSKGSIYIHFNNPTLGMVNVNLTQKIAENGDPNLRGKDIMDQFKYGSSYIRIKISRADNLVAVKGFQTMFSKLMEIYDIQYPKIVKYYRQFIPDFAVSKPVPPRTVPELRLKDIAPEVFVNGYPTTCTHKPTIINDEDIEKEVAGGRKVMVYPDTANEGFPQHNYICTSPKAPYPGLRNNPLKNNDIVPYLPCCYEKDHSVLPQKIYGHYYRGESLKETANQAQQDLIITNKFAPRDKYGILPDDIIQMFDMYHQEGYKFVRKGVFNTKSSFLECVIEGMWEQSGILDLELDTMEERSAYLYDYRERLATPENASSCRQEMYDFTTSEIMEAIRNPDVYLDPKYFINLLELYFNCNIFVFNKTELMIPRHLQSYYKTRMNKPCVLIYEHSGSKSDHAKYPLCELIVRWKVGVADKIKYNSTYSSPICSGISQIYNNIIQSYSLNNLIEETVFPLPDDFVITEQGIDSYGKCRMLRFKYGGVLGTLLTSPIQPLAVVEAKGWIVIPVESKNALEIASKLKIIITKQNIVNDTTRGYSGKLGTVTVTIPVVDSIPIDSIPDWVEGISYTETASSALNNYNNYKKLTRYIIAYMLWLYSIFINDTKKELGPTSILEFTKLYIQIIPDFEYGPVPKTFDIQSGVMHRGKLIVKSEETLKRLLYVLKITSMDTVKILGYYKRVIIENYYSDVTDFDKYQSQVVLQGQESIDKWISERKRSYILHSKVQPNTEVPYFFQNDLVGSDIWLAQNTFDLKKALQIWTTWNTKHYNPGTDPEINDVISDEVTSSFTLYSYRNSSDITMHYIGKDPQNTHIKLLGYKIGDDDFYTVLLPL